MAVEITWNKTDPKALKNSTPYMPYFKPFAPADNLTRDTNKNSNIGTVCELNQTILNKKQSYLPAKPNKEAFGLWSDNISDDAGYFTVDNTPTLRIIFDKPISTAGLTLEFEQGDYAIDITLEWYKEPTVDTLIMSKHFFPDDNLYFCDNLVENYKMLYIKFNKTLAPKRFLKLTNIFYGEIINFTDKELIDCKVLEETSLTSEEISINTLNFTVYNKDNDFNFIKNPKSFGLIEANQPITINKDDVNYGTFYLQKANSDGHKQLEISAVDLMGKLESIPYNGGYFENKTVEFILTDFLEQNDLGAYDTYFDIAPEIENYELTGYIGKTTGRGLLHALSFASWGILDCSRSDKIRITERKKLAVGFSVDDDTLLMDSFKPEYQPRCDGVVISGPTHNLLVKSEVIETIKLDVGVHTRYYNGLYKDIYVVGEGVTVMEVGTTYVTIKTTVEDTNITIGGVKYELIETVNLEIGIHTRYYSEPYHDIQVGGATVIKVGSNFVTIESKGLNYGIVISGIKYSVSTIKFTAGDDRGKNVKILENIEFLSESNGQHIVNNLYDIYNNLNYNCKFEMLKTDILVSDVVDVGGARGYLSKLELDLLRGNLSKGGFIGTSI